MEFNGMINKVHCADCLTFMKDIPDSSIDLIVTDPPYGIRYHSNHGSKKYKERLNNFNWDDSFDFSAFYPDMMRILKENAFMFVFGRIENFETMKCLGFDRLLVWDKNHCGMGNLEDFGIGYEYIYVFKKGKPKIRGTRINGVIRYMHIGYFEKTIHPTQKPEGIMKILIEKASDWGGVVLDPFLGSGTTAVACKMLNRRFIGIEKDEKYCAIANKRIANVPERLTKFLK